MILSSIDNGICAKVLPITSIVLLLVVVFSKTYAICSKTVPQMYLFDSCTFLYLVLFFSLFLQLNFL